MECTIHDLDLEEGANWQFFLEKKGERESRPDQNSLLNRWWGKFPVISMNVDLTLWSSRRNPVLRPAIKSKTSGFEMEGRIED